jgi:hypothetical protein
VSHRDVVSLKIFDILGRQQAHLVNEEVTAGRHAILWDPGDLPSGIYLCRLQADSFCQTKKMVLLK